MNKATAEETKEKLLDDFNTVVSEAEEVLKSAAKEGGERAHALIGKLTHRLKIAKARLDDFQGVAVLKTKAAAQATDHYVHEHPWHAIGAAVGIGIVIGLLLNRR